MCKVIVIDAINLVPDLDEPLFEGWMTYGLPLDQPERLNPETPKGDAIV